jgi:hypothetical protein
MPKGITLVNTGTGWAFQGYATKAGSYLVTVKATVEGNTVTQRIALKVNALPAYAKGSYNGYVETNLEFLNKSIEAVENLVQIYDYMWEEPMFARSVNLLKAYTKVRRMRLHGLVHLVYRMLKPGLESSFVSGKAVSLKLFSFYKLGTFIHYKHYNENKK